MTQRILQQEQESGLVHRAKDGDGDAFAQLYDAYIEQVYRFVHYRVGERQLAEDLSADTFLKAWEHLDRYEERGLPFGAWLFRIARNTVIDHYRTRKAQVQWDETVFQIEDPDAPDVAEAVGTQLAAERVIGALDALTDDQRDVLILKFLQGMNTATVADIMEKKPGAIRALQMRGLQALQTIMGVTDEVADV
ncbi:MAG: sigma-70 family RNA polymerase sigma factor [Candidatus Promineifilaceae bacterium]|nr:sigma-70 family RNA polymerase sigma factor [Candidatus Promineifilaceae bacterium]